MEERYFVDRSFFVQMRAVERDLIADYLDGALDGTLKERFESRYLEVPALLQVVESVRKQRAKATGGSRWLNWALATGLTLVVAVLGFSVYKEIRADRSTPGTEMALKIAPPAEVILRLSPGVTKGADAQFARLTLPAAEVLVRLITELPGQSSAGKYRALVSIIGPGGGRREIWTGPVTQSVPAGGGQEVPVVLHSSILTGGDYVLDLKGESGSVQYTFVFRAARIPDVRERK